MARLGLVYLPTPEVSARIVRYAHALVTGLSARVVVGPAALPHLTLLHVETDRPPAEVFAEARETVPARCRFGIGALGLLRYDTPYNAPPAPPGTMAWLMVPCSEALRAAERAACASPAFRGMTVTTGNGDTFQPHLTIAMWDGHEAPRTFAPPADLLPCGDLEGTLALGVIGENGTFLPGT